MPESFGARLRRQREEQKIELATIAEQTKIKLSLLEGLERDDVSHWPSGIFRRAYLRTYADAIGLSPDAVVREFVELYPEPGEDLATISAAASGSDVARARGGPPTRLSYIVGSALGSLSRLRRTPVRDTASLEPASDVVADPRETIHVFQSGAIADDGPVSEPESAVPVLPAVAQLCTELGRVDDAAHLQMKLQDAATLLDASGLIIWLWDASRAELRAALAHGYSDKVLAHLPAVTRDADNATATAFRSGQVCAIKGTDHTNGALAVPLLAPGGCAGVLAIEVQHGAEQTMSVRAVATILAALLAQLIGGGQPAEVQPQPEMIVNASAGLR